MKKQLRPNSALKRKSLSAKQLQPFQSHVIRGGEDKELYPWIDQPGG
ncbi:MAG: hypothetical protein U0176_06800 [Bacteroidia bacterium]